MTGPTLASLADDLSAGRTTARHLLEACLERIAEPGGQGSVVYREVDAAGSRAAADAMDAMRAAGAAPSAFAGIPVSVKDLFDVRGQVTAAGSRVLAHELPAVADAPLVARLRANGFVLVGRTNMTEFAFSGLGLNPHYGTPVSRTPDGSRRIAGGSSSGAAASVADGMAHGAVGTDTGGSCRIPATFCGLVGYKPTVGAIPAAGTIPLSTTLDSAGPIARSVSCARTLTRIMAGGSAQVDAEPSWPVLRHLTFAVPQTTVLDGMDATVAAAFERTLATLSAAGARIVEAPFLEFGEVAAINAQGGLGAAEGFAWHRARLAAQGESYDPRVAARLRRGEAMSAADYIDLLAARASFVERVGRRMAAFDAAIFPTVPVVALQVAPLEEDDAAYLSANLLVLRNSTLINVADGCAISLPMHQPGEFASGLTLASGRGGDAALLDAAEAVEEALAVRA